VKIFFGKFAKFSKISLSTSCHKIFRCKNIVFFFAFIFLLQNINIVDEFSIKRHRVNHKTFVIMFMLQKINVFLLIFINLLIKQWII